MQEPQALTAFAAISQETRLRIIRRLLVAGADGMSAGAIGEAVGASASGLSFHLNHLEQADLIESRREGRFIIYSAIFPALSDLVAFLMRDCCEGHCKVCDQAIALFSRCTGRPMAGGLKSRKLMVCDDAAPKERQGQRKRRVPA
ncbi:ArsR/SmtB family transcription factor [Belnapia rosea]|uniref:Transcriptional regulator, ArsR family n=1 Tax=Belnapia rosea TaxID=938405 RepID=A0A1G6YZ52_9PROT|nr:transcriptional regulator, ArsR family [Belnapia rosea]